MSGPGTPAAGGSGGRSGPGGEAAALWPHGVRLRHRFQAAHRLPQLAGQCQSLHGHSWEVAVTVTAAELTCTRTVVEFGAFKAGVRGWIDAHLDHGVMLAAADALVPALTADGTKVFRFGADGRRSAGEDLAADLRYPTVEEVAALLCRVAAGVLAGVPHALLARVGLVEVDETDVNRAWYAPTYPPPRPEDRTPAPTGAVIG